MMRSDWFQKCPMTSVACVSALSKGKDEVKIEQQPKARIFVCINEKAPGKAQCLKGEGDKCVMWLRGELKSRGLDEKIWITKTRCQDYCGSEGTALCFEPTHKQFSNVKLEDLPSLLEEFLRQIAPIL